MLDNCSVSSSGLHRQNIGIHTLRKYYQGSLAFIEMEINVIINNNKRHNIIFEILSSTWGWDRVVIVVTQPKQQTNTRISLFSTNIISVHSKVLHVSCNLILLWLFVRWCQFCVEGNDETMMIITIFNNACILSVDNTKIFYSSLWSWSCIVMTNCWIAW